MKLTSARDWIWIVVRGTATVCILAFLSASSAVAGAATPKPEFGSPAQSSTLEPQHYEGMITDTHCGAKHSAAVGMSAADCTRVCIHGGEHFALVDGEKAYALKGDETALKRVAGQRVKIVGTLNGNTISVASVTPAS